MSESSILFHWSLCLFLCQYHAVCIAMALYYSLKSGVVILLVLLFLFRTALAIQVLLNFHMNFKIYFSIFVKNAIEILIRIALNI
jgi:hypothetical protein